MSIQAELEKAREEQRLNVPAKRILEKVQTIPSDSEKLQRRWFWELLQNASDYNEKVDVVLELFEDKLVFKHNGNPFKPIDTENLIAPDSGKDDMESRTEDMIGQFGTGFISTHVLSSLITVEGVIKSQDQTGSFGRFKFDLDRSGFNDKEEHKKAITKSSKQLNESIRNVAYSDVGFDTIFTYHLSHNLPGIDKGQAVRPGLEHLTEVLPYTLAFMPKVKSVRIRNNGTSFVDYFEQEYHPQPFVSTNKQFRVAILSKTSEFGQLTRADRQFITENYGQAMVIAATKSGSALPFPERITTLFCALPMIGTEEFSFPTVLNSAKFVPKTERDGIRLTQNSEQNRSIIKSAVAAYCALISRMVTANMDGLYNLCSWKPFRGDDSEKAWFREQVTARVKSHLQQSDVLLTEKAGVRTNLANARIPFFNSEELKKGQLLSFYELCGEIMPERVPAKREFEKWFEYIDFSVFTECKYELKDLLNEVQSIGNGQNLENRVSDFVNWLNRLFRVVIAIDINLLDQFKILPNQLGTFVSRKDPLYYDDNLPPELIEVHNALTGQDYKSSLLHRSFDGIEGILDSDRVRDEAILAKAIDDQFSEFPENARSNSRFQDGLRRMFKWMAETDKSLAELKELFKWFVPNRPQLFLETFDDENKHRVLSIAQSGKLESLAEIANSDLTSADVKRIAENIHDLDALAKVLDNVPNAFSELVKYAHMLKADEEEFQYRKDIGERIEKVFRQALEESGIRNPDVKGEPIEHEGIGSYDFKITNLENEQSYFIELKSYKHGSTYPLRLAKSQAKRARDQAETFSLVTLERPAKQRQANLELTTVDYIRRKARSAQEIGDLVSEALTEHDQLIRIQRGGRLHVTWRGQVRVNLSKDSVLARSTDFDNLIARIVQSIQ